MNDVNKVTEKPIANSIQSTDFVLGIVGGALRRFPIALVNNNNLHGNAYKAVDPGVITIPTWWFAADGKGVYPFHGNLEVTKTIGIISWYDDTWSLYEVDIDPGDPHILVSKGGIDCSTNPDYPPSSQGWVYKVLNGGKIGGVDGLSVNTWDTIICEATSPGGSHAAVGSDFSVTPANFDNLVHDGRISGTIGVIRRLGTAPNYTYQAGFISAQDVDLGNVDNTADMDKPISTLAAAAIAERLLASDFTKANLGLENVDNTSDASKPVSTAVAALLNQKAPTVNPAFTGTVSGVTKSMVGLSNVDNTADADKPLSDAVKAALDAKADKTGLSSAKVEVLSGNHSITAADSSLIGSPLTENIEFYLPAISSVGITTKSIRRNAGNLYALTIFRSGSDAINFNGVSRIGLTSVVGGAWLKLVSDPTTNTWVLTEGGDNWSGI